MQGGRHIHQVGGAGDPRAFSLTELLVVLGVLASLAAIVVPTIGRSVELARRAICSANLRQIGTAYGAHKAAELTEGYVSVAENPFEARATAQPIGADLPVYSYVLSPDNWATVLASRVGGKGAFDCPSIQPSSRYGALPDLRLRVWGTGGAEKTDYEIFITGAFNYWDYGTASQCYQHPGIWKFNSEPQAADFPEWRDNSDRMPQYEPGEDPNVYWYLLETARYGDDYHAGGDLDCNDLVLKITETDDGILIEPYQLYGWAGQTYNLVDAESGQVIGSETESVGRDGNFGPFKFDRTNTSYGMNSETATMSPGSHTVLVLDYNHSACRVGEAAADGLGTWDDLKAPRHLGKCNVLFGDGSVQTLAPDRLDPTDATNYQTYWASGVTGS